MSGSSKGSVGPRVAAGGQGLAGSATPPRLTLLGGFELSVGGTTARLPRAAQRLVVFLALEVRPVARSHAAGALWPDTDDGRAHGSLRSALWRLRRLDPPVVEADRDELRLAPTVRVDLREGEALAHRMLDPGFAAEDGRIDPQPLAEDLLPEWEEDWVAFERERFRELRLHALEALSRRRTDAGRFAEAIDAALLAVETEPLRETAHRALIRAYLAEGNWGRAVRQYEELKGALRGELGVEPSRETTELVHALTRR